MILRNMKILQEYEIFVDWQTFVLWERVSCASKILLEINFAIFSGNRTLISKKAQHSFSTTRLVTVSAFY